MRNVRRVFAIECACIITFASLFSSFPAIAEAEDDIYGAVDDDALAADMADDGLVFPEGDEDVDSIVPDEPDMEEDDDAVSDADEDDVSGLIVDETGVSELWISNEEQLSKDSVPYLFGLIKFAHNVPSDISAVLVVSSETSYTPAVPEGMAAGQVIPFTVFLEGSYVPVSELKVYVDAGDDCSLYIRGTDGSYTPVDFETGSDDTGVYLRVYEPEVDCEYVFTSFTEEDEGEPSTEGNPSDFATADTNSVLDEDDKIAAASADNGLDGIMTTDADIEAKTEAGLLPAFLFESKTEGRAVAVTGSNKDEEHDDIVSDDDLDIDVESASEMSPETESETEVETETKTEIELKNESETETKTEIEPETETETEVVTDETECETPYVDGEMSVVKDGYSVCVVAGQDALIPYGSYVEAEEIYPGTDRYEECLRQAKLVSGFGENTSIPETAARFFDISILYEDDGKTVVVEPASSVVVRILLDDPIPVETDDNFNVVHFVDGEENAPDVIDAVDTGQEENEGGFISRVEFGSESFSVFGMVDTTFHKTVISSNGDLYEIDVTYDESARIPSDAGLLVTEIDESSDRYLDYKKAAESVAGYHFDDEASYLRLFDIRIEDGDGEVQPADGSLVSVDVHLGDMVSEGGVKVVHFASRPELIVPAVDTSSVSFETGSFSVYAIIDDPVAPPTHGEGTQITSMAMFEEYLSDGLYIGNPGGYYLTDGITKITATRTGITKTAQAATPDTAVGAVAYYFEPVEGTDKYLVYCVNAVGAKMYVKQSTNSLSFTNQADATEFSVQAFPNGGAGVFRIVGDNNYCWNMQGGTTGKSFAAYNNLTDVNAKLVMWHYEPMADDPFGLDGQTFSLAYINGTTSACGVLNSTVTVQNTTRLAADATRIQSDIIEQEGLLVTSGDNLDLADWTFENVAQDRYYMTTVVDGDTKYLSFTDTGVALLDEPDPSYSVITVSPGTGSHSGSFKFVAAGKVLSFSGAANTGFIAQSSDNGQSWLNLVRKHDVLEDDDFVTYVAHMVNISDVTAVPDGQAVVMYTAIWNPDALRYDFYVVDYNGKLIRCYESGSMISWVGGQVNTALWDFTEYHYDNGTPNYYYDLQNRYSGQYIAPQFTNGQILSDNKIGINMNGRRYGDDFTTLIAWDNNYYSYAGIGVSDGQLVSSSFADSQEFYFAIIDTSEDELTTNETIDNSEYGITMKMVDYDHALVNNRDALQSQVLGRETNSANLLQPRLVDGYPMTNSDNTGQPSVSLSTLFADEGGLRDVNHLFIKSIYEENGYFEYDSTQNFAHLEDNGNFTVYDQIGSFHGDNGITRTHGQFMPYNDIQSGSFTGTLNLTDVFAQPLSDLDPRKYEPLYNIANPDYFFGMEMETGFTQTESGLDARGNDIVFEFSGDDDFWLYVDGELVLDLGGVHAASVGKINFRTGVVEMVVKDSKGAVIASRTVTTTLYDIFANNYRYYNPSATNEEVTAYLDNIFDLNENGQYVFRDYSIHRMKMFYMERGAGASNLHMRFNSTSVRERSVILSKSVSGNVSADFLQAEFPYQIHYRTTSEPNVDHILTEFTDGDHSVKYVGRNVPVKYQASYTPPGTNLVYENVFFLRHGENAEILLPRDVTDYYITECGLNTHIYDAVEINGEACAGIDKGGDRADYATGWANYSQRQHVFYDNHITDSALRVLTFRKILVDKDGNELSASDDSQTFDFRLYLGSENDAAPTAAYMRDYYVKNEAHEYCTWNNVTKTFDSTGVVTFDQLTPQQKRSAVFTTSPTGAIARIPVGYTVEVRDLVVGSRFRVQERPDEIPKGYSFVEYDRDEASYIVEDENVPNNGIVRENADPALDVKNRQGWGISGVKEWSDDDFVTEHGDIYFGVCVNGVLLEDTVTRLENGVLSAYWYFDDLLPGASFEDYQVMELVQNGSTFEPVPDGDPIQIDAIPEHSSDSQAFSYNVSYVQGTKLSGGNENVRTDTVSNSRDGLRIIKTDMDGNALPGAVFTLTDGNGDPVAAQSYTSKANGIVTTAYLNDGTYNLSEILAPNTYIGLSSPVVITVENNTVTVSSECRSEYYSLTKDQGSDMYTLQIKNKPYSIHLTKEDMAGDALGGAHFAIYRQVETISGTVRKDYRPLPGYDDLVSDAGTGLISDTVANLGPGVYYVTETSAPAGYELLDEDMALSISNTGQVSMLGSRVRLTSSESLDEFVYAIMIQNTNIAGKKVRLKKVDIDDPFGTFLDGAVFDLYLAGSQPGGDTLLYEDVVSGDDGFLLFGEDTVISLLPGVYKLVEKTPPEGYFLKTNDVIITVTDNDVTYDEDTVLSSEGTGLSYDTETEVYTLLVSNEINNIIPPTGMNERNHLVMILLCACFIVMVCSAVFRSKRRRSI